MKRPDDRRLWIDRLGVRMDEPRVRYVINTEQVMTSTEYDGDYRPEFYEFREALDVYFEFCKDAALAKQRGLPVPEVPEALVKYLTRGASGNAAKAKAHSDKAKG